MSLTFFIFFLYLEGLTVFVNETIKGIQAHATNHGSNHLPWVGDENKHSRDSDEGERKEGNRFKRIAVGPT